MNIHYWLDGSWCKQEEYTHYKGKRYRMTIPEDVSDEVISEVVKKVCAVLNK